MATLHIIPRAKDLYAVIAKDGNKVICTSHFFTSTFNPAINLPGIKIDKASPIDAMGYGKLQSIYSVPLGLSLATPLKDCVDRLIRLVSAYGETSVNNHKIKSLYFVSSRDFTKPNESWLNKAKPVLRLLVMETPSGPKVSAYMGKITFSAKGIDIKMGGKSRDAIQDCINLMQGAKMFAIM